MYRDSSMQLVRRILDIHGCSDVRLVKGDIAKVDDALLSPQYSVVLMDVDLSEPTYQGLRKFYPRLAPGGVILVDDCDDVPEQVWRARKGFEQFCREEGLPVRMIAGLGLIEKPV